MKHIFDQNAHVKKGRRWIETQDTQKPANYQAALKALEDAHKIIAEQNQAIIDLLYKNLSDGHTKTLNKEGFKHIRMIEMDRLKNGQTEAGVILNIDMARLKFINDTHGHDAGDAAIKIFSDTLKKHVRESDHVARVGGDEFLVILTNTTTTQALNRIYALGDHIGKIEFTHNDIPLITGGRMGIAEYSATNSFDNALIQADQRQNLIRRIAPDSFRRETLA